MAISAVQQEQLAAHVEALTDLTAQLSERLEMVRSELAALQQQLESNH